MKPLLSWLVAAAVGVVRWSCRVRIDNDPRIALRAAGVHYVYAILHAHHLTALLVAERGLVVMVSRSKDGDIALPTLQVCGCIAVRGSGGGRGKGKGGGPAMTRMIKYVDAGHPAVLTVDGPVGPRGHVRPGIALLSAKTGAAVIPMAVIASRRRFLTKTWDRLQIPLPFTRIDLHAGATMFPNPGESLEAFSRRIERELRELERRHDPGEAASADSVRSAA